ncbi:hypothetical protein C8A05DRAFT_40557 [Staphylotrichum tortipilum]|uniref:Uncharacterized protein n=1 Tax=Staphylotrichum tortipilum TaxID=2831512 RepID=A0AAN6MT16_9PEZI|nr:hypothetical protein C8A05DRAFT_40557 [Staphylotrichum longicolle]
MEHPQHVGAIPELNLSTCQPNTLVNTLNSVPGLKTSAAFLTFLRANIILPHSAASSNVSTPLLGPYPSHSLPPVSPSPLSMASPQPPVDSDIPPLSLEILTERADKAAALNLVADSIAQQRQRAALHLVFHPLLLAPLAAVLAVVYRYAWIGNSQHDLGTTLMLASGTIMTYLIGIRFATSGYLRAAEDVSWDFISAGQGAPEDLILGTRYGPDMIGALVLRLERPASDHTNGGSGGGGGGGRRKSHSRQNSLKGGKGVIRAWTTRLRYRGKGIGGDLLREAVRVTREQCGKDAEVGFAMQHANSVMVLPEMFNRPFRKGEMRAAKALEKVLGEWDGRRR